MKSDTKSINGFTLMELMIVLLLIVVISTIFVVAYLESTNGSAMPKKANQNFTQIDEQIRNLPWQELAYAPPEELEIGENYKLELLLGGDNTFEQLAEKFRGMQGIIGANIQVSHLMTAELTGDSFEIKPITPVKQAISSTEVTRWAWSLTGQNLGRHPLHLSLNAHLNVDGEKEQRSVRTYENAIAITIKSANGVWAAMQRYWMYLSAGVAAIAVFFKMFFSNLKRSSA